MEPTPIPIPFGGVTDAAPAAEQPVAATDPDGLLNLVPTDRRTGRRQLATRPGLVLEFGNAAGLGRVQALGEIGRAAGVSGTTVSDLQRTTEGDGRPSGTIRGQAVILDVDRSIRLVADDQRGTGLSNPPAGPGGYGAFVACFHATDPDIAYFGTVATDTAHTTQSSLIVGLNRVSLATNGITHQQYAVDAAPGYSVPMAASPPDQNWLLANQIVQHGPYLFVAAQRYVYTFLASDLTYINRHQINYAEEVQSIAVATVNGRDYLFTLCTGTIPDVNEVVADAAGEEAFGEFYRSAIQIHEIHYLTGPSPDGGLRPVGVGGTVFTRRAMPMGLQSTDAGYVDHRGFRFSEYSQQRPRGCLPYAFAVKVDADGGVYAYVVRTNQGWGYNGNLDGQRPDGLAAPVSICRAVLTRAFETPMPAYVSPLAPVRYGLSPAVGGWERDTGSLRRPYTWDGNTWYNDIPARDVNDLRDPHLDGNEPTLFAVAVNAEHDLVVAAGRRSSLSLPTSTVFAFRPSDGALLWEVDTVGFVQQHGVTFDPVSGNVLVAMIRKSGWIQQDGTPSADKAELLELAAFDGATVRAFDLTDNINTNGYITPALGGVGAYAVACNSRGQVIVGLAPYRFDV